MDDCVPAQVGNPTYFAQGGGPRAPSDGVAPQTDLPIGLGQDDVTQEPWFCSASQCSAKGRACCTMQGQNFNGRCVTIVRPLPPIVDIAVSAQLVSCNLISN